MISLKRYEQCVAIANDESRDLRVRVIALRMAMRVCSALSSMRRQEMAQARRMLRAHRFTTHRLATLENAYREFRDYLKESLEHSGRWLVVRSKELDALGFSTLCDLLSVNPVHRSQVKGLIDDHGNADSLTGHLLWDGGCFEDSAEHLSGRRKRWKTGPLTQAKTAALHRALLDHPQILKQAFAPGGPLYGVPSYTMQPDGSMKRNAPALVVHSRDGGQRVVERSGR